MAELHVFEYGGTTYGTFGKTCFKLKINHFLSSYPKSQNRHFHTPSSKFLATAKVGWAHYNSFHGVGSHLHSVEGLNLELFISEQRIVHCCCYVFQFMKMYVQVT